MRTRSRTLVLSFLVLAAGCSSTASSASPSAASGAAGPPSGAKIYAAKCASCHGSDLRGTRMGPSHLSQVYEPGHHSDESFRAAIAKGAEAHHWSFGDMPPIPGMTPDEVTAVIAYVREVQRREGFEPSPR